MTLSDRIESDLASRLKSGVVPCPIKLESLARFYGVSTRPIREVLARLRQRKILTPKTLAALRIESEPAAPSLADSNHSNLFRKISRDLVQRSLHGEDAFLREAHIAKQFNVSTTMIRELFSKLVGQGILLHVPRRGWRLRPLTQKDLNDFTDVRVILEQRALELAWDRLDLAIIRAYLDANTLPRDSTRPISTYNGFHREIIQRSDNHYILDFFERHGPYFELFFDWESTDVETANDEIRQHRQILEAILARDLAKAQTALAHHIRSNNPALNELLR